MVSLENLFKLPEQITQKIKKLQLVGNSHGNISEKIKNFTNLEDLDLQSNKLTKLPNFITSLSKLKVLNVSRNDLEELPVYFGSLSELITLKINDNEIQRLDFDFLLLQKLKTVIAHGNAFKAIPVALYFLKKLEHLNFEQNRIEYLLPTLDDIMQLKAETEKRMSLQGIVDFETKIEQQMCPNLQYLKCDTNQIKIIPSNIKYLTNLTHVTLSDNFIKTVPMELLTLPKLSSLVLANNILRGFPIETKNIKNKALYIDISANMMKMNDTEELGVGCNTLIRMFNIKNLGQFKFNEKGEKTETTEMSATSVTGEESSMNQ